MTSYYDNKKPFKRMSEETFLELLESEMRWNRERISNGFYVIQQINDKQRERKNTPHDNNYNKGDEENNSLILVAFLMRSPTYSNPLVFSPLVGSGIFIL